MKAIVEFVIEELVLEGFAAIDRDRIEQTFIQELTRLLANGIPPTLDRAFDLDRDLDRLTLEIASDRPDAIALQLAESIYQGLCTVDAEVELG